MNAANQSVERTRFDPLAYGVVIGITRVRFVLALTLAGCAQPQAPGEPQAARAPSTSVAEAGATAERRRASNGAVIGTTGAHNEASARPSATQPSSTQSTPIDATALRASVTWPAAMLDSRAASHLAAGKRRVAAIVLDADATRRLVVFTLPEPDRDPSHVKVSVDVPLPPSLQTAATETFSMFFGRDDWPRVIVAPPPVRGAVTYHRYRPNEGWTSPADEQGALAAGGRAAGYYGTLGHRDPEVLCVPGKSCYEKRSAGWTTRPVPGPGVWHLTLAAKAEAPHDVTAWAWLKAAVNPVLQLNGEWEEPLPQLPQPLVALAAWNAATLVALTPSALYRYGLPVEGPRDASSAEGKPAARGLTPPAWSLIAKVERGSVLSGAAFGMLVGTASELLQWIAPRTELSRVVLEVNTKPIATGEILAIESTLEARPRYVVACEAGVVALGHL